MKLYNVQVSGVTTKEAMENLFLELNNCEFCNNATFRLSLKEFSYNEEDDTGVGVAEVSFTSETNIQDKLCEIVNCEFCHAEEERICFAPIESPSVVESYWVSFLIQDTENSKPCLCPMTDSCFSLEAAKKVIKKGRRNFRVLSAWIDTFDKDNVKTTVFHECYIDSMGMIK